MGYSAGQLDSRQERDRVNAAMRASDVWRNAIKGMGLNPDGPLNLTKSQQSSLAQTLGVPLSDFHIDGAGNINDFHGWKGLPTGAKIAIIAGAALGTAGAAGAFGGGAGAAGAAGSGGAATGAATSATAVGTGATVAATAGPTLAGTLLKYGLQYGVPVVGGLISSKVAANANTDAARLESEYNNRALDEAIKDRDYERRQGEDERAYQRRIDSYERDKYSEGEGYGRAKYNEATNYGRRNYGNFVETLEPYRAAGVNANQFASRLLGQEAPAYTGGTYYDLARDARKTVDLPTNVNLPQFNYPSTGEHGDGPYNSSGRPNGGTITDANGLPTSTSQPVGGGNQLVAMKAPNGMVKQIPASEVQHYLDQGAVLV